jgi:hypothetical protein
MAGRRPVAGVRSPGGLAPAIASLLAFGADAHAATNKATAITTMRLFGVMSVLLLGTVSRPGAA